MQVLIRALARPLISQWLIAAVIGKFPYEKDDWALSLCTGLRGDEGDQIRITYVRPRL
jgi:hypothetical protein